MRLQYYSFVLFCLFLNFCNRSQAQQIDDSYGTGSGHSLVDFNDDYDQAYDVTWDYQDRTIILARIYVGTEFHVGVLRLTSEGLPDVEFDGDGKAEFTQFTGSNEVAVDGINRIYVGAFKLGEDGTNDFHVFRLLENGTLDPDYGVGGEMIYSFTPDVVESVFSMLVQNDGKLLIGGLSGVTDSFQAALARFNEDGTVDDTFGDEGVVFFGEDSSSEFLTQIIKLQSGNIMVYVETDEYVNSTGYLIELDANGGLFDSFGDNGSLLLLDAGYDAAPAEFVQLTDGNILVCGVSATGVSSAYLMKLDQTGNLMSDFGTNGIAEISNNGLDVYLYEITEQPSGKLILTGTDGSDFLMARVTSDGALDPTFSLDGFWKPSFTSSYESMVGAHPIGTNKVVVAGTNVAGFNADLLSGRVITDAEIGVENSSVNEYAEVFPNPCDGSKFQLNCNAVDGIHSLEILSTEMKVLERYNLPFSNSSTVVELENNLPNGMYFVRLSGEGNHLAKFVVNR